MRRALLTLALALAASCSDDGEDNFPATLKVDPALSLEASLGGDIGLAVDIDDCSTIGGPANAKADGSVLATLDAPEVLQFAGGKRFIITVPGSALDNRDFDVPVQLKVSIDVECDGERVKTEPYAFTYVPTLRSFVTAAGVDRFWPSDVEGEVLTCDGADIVRYDGAGTELSRFSVGFSCALGELRGSIGERRLLTVDSGGMAAIDPGPVLAWTRHTPPVSPLPEERFVFDAVWFRADSDLAIQYKQVAGGVPQVALASRETGLNISPLLPLVYRALGAVSRDAAGNIAVLTAAKEVVENVYYIELFDAAGAQVRPPIEASRYPAGTPYAEFSFEGDRLYVQADDGNQNRWIQSVTVNDGVVTQLTQPADGWRNVLGEIFFRVLVSSDDEFVWIDRDDGSVQSQPFAPDSGNNFYRLRVEPDGSCIMLADETGAGSASGFYVFGPDGRNVIRLHGNDQSYGWMTESWSGGSLVSVQDASLSDVQVIPTAADYAAR